MYRSCAGNPADLEWNYRRLPRAREVLDELRDEARAQAQRRQARRRIVCGGPIEREEAPAGRERGDLP